MTKTIDDIVPRQKGSCNNCPFCLSRCLKCGSLHISVYIQNDYGCFNFTNTIRNRIYLNKVKKQIFPSNIKRGITVSCNRCGNAFESIDITNGDYPVLKTYNKNSPDKFLHGNSKYNNQLKKLYDFYDRYSNDEHFYETLPCKSVCLYFDETKKNKEGRFPVQIERILDIKSRNKEYSKGKIKLEVNYLEEFKKFYTVISQTIYCRNPSA
jgi:hypothetical protein